MSKIVACIDGSAYAHAVCEFAALFADRLDTEVQLLAVRESPGLASFEEAAVRMGGERLSEHGFERFSTEVVGGDFLDAVGEAAAGADLVVMGKRGVDHGATLDRLGRHVEPVLRRLPFPTCLVSQLFLPISRALVVLDSDPDHRTAMEFATGSPLLAGTKLELLLMDDGRHVTNEKLTAARGRLEGRPGAAYCAQARNPDRAIADFGGGTDLMVMSREMLFGPAGSALLPGDETSFWRKRTPILVC